jgi:NhaA family Na+:H+ antiporter
VHATLIGVAFGLITPAYALLAPGRYPEIAGRLVDDVARRAADGVVDPDEHELNEHTLREIRRLSLEARSPLHRAETRLAPYVAFGIVPVFAFANAGFRFPSVAVSEWLTDPVVAGIALGLVVGKPTGIFGAAWLAVRLGVARFPPAMRTSHLFGVSLTGGIGFTVAIFVATLAFDDGSVVEMAKLGIMLASTIAAVLGFLTLRLVGGKPTADRRPPRRQHDDTDLVATGTGG